MYANRGVRLVSVALAALVLGGVTLIPKDAEAQSTQDDSPTVVSAGSVLVPPGLSTGDEFRVLFLTSTKRDGTSTDIGVYNSFVQAAAAAGHESIADHSGGFRAVASTADVDARDNTGTTGEGVPIYWLGGDKVADDYADFYDGTWDEQANGTDETGSERDITTNLNSAWTGSDNDGTAQSLLGFARSLGGDGTFFAAAADAGGSGSSSGPLSGKSSRRSNQRSLYALSKVFTVGPQVVSGGSVLVPPGLSTGDEFRVLFLTSTKRDGTSTDIGVYNSFVQAAAAAGHEAIADHSGGFRAVASTAAVDARDNTGTTGEGVPIYWLGGDKVADDYADFYDGTWDEQANGTDETGSERDITTNLNSAWTGSDNDGTAQSLLGFARSLGGDGTFFAAAADAGGSGSSSGPLSGKSSRRSNQRSLYALSKVFTVGPQVVSGGSVLVPPGLSTGDEFRVLFLTSTKRDGTSTDIGVYNSFVQAAAAAGHEAIADHSGGFRAVASTADVDARDNTGTTGEGVPIYWLGGDKVADDYADFYDGTWDEQANGTDETGSERDITTNLNSAWTGSDNDGTAQSLLGFARSLGGDGTFFAAAADAGGSGSSSGPLSGKSSRRSNQRSLYALSKVFTVGPQVVSGGSVLVPPGLSTGDEFRVLFLTSTKRDGTSTDIGVYNSFVQAAAAAGHEAIADHSGGFRAVASTADVDARDNTGTTGEGVPIYWLGGDKVADDYADFYDGTWDEQANGTDETGSERDITTNLNSAWTGSDNDGTAQNLLGFARSLGGDGTFFAAAADAGGSGSSSGPLSGKSSRRSNQRSLYALSKVFTVGPQVVSGGSVLVPPGLSTGDEFRVLFLTSTKRDGTSTDIGVYNSFVQAAAAAGHEAIADYSGGFRAVASTADVDARDNTGTTGEGVPIYWLGGDKVADDYADFYDGTWDEQANGTDETGSERDITTNLNSAWTGSDHDGTAQNLLGFARSLGGDGTFFAAAADAGGSGSSSGPLSGKSSRRSNQRSLYALSKVFTVGPQVVLSLEALSIVEGSSAVYTVVLDAEPSDSVTIDISGDEDVTVKPASLTFTVETWEAAQSVTVSAAEDLDAVDDVVSITHAVAEDSAAEYAGISVGSVAVTVVDDDAAGVSVSPETLSVVEGSAASYAVVLDAEPTGRVSVDVSGGGDVTAEPASLVFTAESWDTAQSVRVTAAEDADTVDDVVSVTHAVSSGSAAEFVGLAVDSVAVTVNDNDAAGVSVSRRSLSVDEGDSGTYTVRLTFQPSGTVRVDVAGGGDVTAVPASLVFTTDNWDTTQTVTVHAAEDLDASDDFQTVTHAVASNSAGEYVGLGVDSVAVTVVDNDVPEVTVRFEQQSYTVSEGGSVTVRVRLSANPRRTVEVPLTATQLGGATPLDYSGIPASVRFAGGATVRSFAFAAAADAVDERGESVRIGFGTLPAKVTAGVPSVAVVSIVDANRAPTVLAAAEPAEVYAGETVTLSGTAGDPDGDTLSFAWTSDGGGEFVPDASVLSPGWVAPATYAAFTANLTLTVTDEHGASASFTVSVVVEPVPAPNAATGLDAEVDEDSSVLLSWTIPAQPRGVTITSVQVQQRDSRGVYEAPVWDTVATLTGAHTRQALTGLAADTEHVLRVRLTSNHGLSADSRPLRVRTLTQAPALLSFGAQWPTQTSITLGWTTVETAAQYKLEYRKVGESGWTRVVGDFDDLPSSSDLRWAFGTAAGLECNTVYEFRVSARGNGTQRDDYRTLHTTFGPHATTTATTGQCPQPEHITNLLVSVEPHCATLTWTPPSGDRDSGYRVERYSYTHNLTQRSEPVTLAEHTDRVAARYQDCSAAYRTDGADHVWIVTALANNPGPGQDAEFGSAYTPRLVYGPSEHPESPRNVALTHDTPPPPSRTLAWDTPLDPWLSTLKTARTGPGLQQTVTDPWITGYRIERAEYRTDDHGDWYLPDDGVWETLRYETDVDTATTHTDTTDQDDTRYVYRVWAHNNRGPNHYTFDDDWAFTGPNPEPTE